MSSHFVKCFHSGRICVTNNYITQMQVAFYCMTFQNSLIPSAIVADIRMYSTPSLLILVDRQSVTRHKIHCCIQKWTLLNFKQQPPISGNIYQYGKSSYQYLDALKEIYIVERQRRANKFVYIPNPIMYIQKKSGCTLGSNILSVME